MAASITFSTANRRPVGENMVGGNPAYRISSLTDDRCAAVDCHGTSLPPLSDDDDDDDLAVDDGTAEAVVLILETEGENINNTITAARMEDKNERKEGIIFFNTLGLQDLKTISTSCFWAQ